MQRGSGYGAADCSCASPRTAVAGRMLQDILQPTLQISMTAPEETRHALRISSTL